MGKDSSHSSGSLDSVIITFQSFVLIICFFPFKSVQISGDLEGTMNEIFTKYDGEGAETKAVDILQTQVGVMFPCILIAFSSHLCFHSLTPVQLCLHILLSFPSLVFSILKVFFPQK